MGMILTIVVNRAKEVRSKRYNKKYFIVLFFFDTASREGDFKQG